MKELIKIELNENQEPIVNGRELHKALGVKTAYKDWFRRMVEYGFNEGQDFCSILSERCVLNFEHVLISKISLF